MRKTINRPARFVMAALLAIAAISTSHAMDDVKTKIYTGWLSNVAINGYDPVAYFTVGTPTKGNSDFTDQWGGATWKFANAANRDKFSANPEKYAPQYGGYCAWAIAEKNDLVKTSPKAWAIKDGKLYLNYSSGVQKDWDKDPAGFITKGDSNWTSKGYTR